MGVFQRTDGSIFFLYVDDFVLVAAVQRENVHQMELAAAVKLTEEAAPNLIYLGAMYRLASSLQRCHHDIVF